MINKSSETLPNTETLPASAAVALQPDTADSSNTTAKKRHVTSGEKIFDRTVYTGIGFGVNEVGSMIIADELRYGKNKYFGKTLFDKASELWVKTFKLKDKVKNGKTLLAKGQAETTLEVGALLIGGTLLVVPMKWLEDHKAEWVKKANHLMDKLQGNKLDAEAVKARDEEVENAIACQPKQSWTSLLIGRAMAVVTNMLILSNTVFRESTTNKIKDFSEEYVTKATVKTDQLLGDKPDSAIKKMMGDPNISKYERRFPRYARILGIETLYTLSSSAVLEIGSKLVARKKPLVHDEERCNKVTAEPALKMGQDVPPTVKYTETIKPRSEQPTLAKAKGQDGFVARTQKTGAESDHALQPGL